MRRNSINQVKEVGLGIYLIIFIVVNCFAEEDLSYPADENEKYSVSISRIDDADSPSRKHKNVIVLISNKITEETKEIQFLERIRGINQCIVCDSSKAILIGDLTRSGQMAIVADLISGKVEDSIRNYGLSISNSKRYLIYLNFAFESEKKG